MIIYLTSDPGGVWDVDCKPTPRPFKKENGFIKMLRKDVSKYRSYSKAKKCLIVCASPDDHQTNDERVEAFRKSFKRAFLRFSAIDMCDSRNPRLIDHLSDYSLVFLLGGHAPTQNRFFNDIGLKNKISDYTGVLLSLSAGSMNCAKEVYLLPEDDADFLVPLEDRFVPGLGLTDIQMIPHFQYLSTVEYEGQNLIDDFVLNESKDHQFTGICDGSFFRIDTTLRKTDFYGEGYIIENETKRPL